MTPILSFTWIQIRAIDRKQEVPHDGPMCDLLWSDPDGEPSLRPPFHAKLASAQANRNAITDEPLET